MQVYDIVLMPPGHPIILLKSNYFNMAAVSVKRSIEVDDVLVLEAGQIQEHTVS